VVVASIGVGSDVQIFDEVKLHSELLYYKSFYKAEKAK